MDSNLNLSLMIADLKAVRLSLLRLHKALLENEKSNYENLRGRIVAIGEYYNLVLNHEQFAWLRALSGLIVEIDEATDAKVEPLDEEKIIALARAIEKLTNAPESEDFGAKYQAALQASPDAMFEHIKVLKGLEKFRNEV
jgi:hypothetical protein